MPTGLERIQRLIDAGSSTPNAIREVLGMQVKVFSLKYGRPAPLMGRVISGLTAPSAKDLSALIAELGGTEEGWRRLLWLAGEQVAQVVG